MRLKRGLSITSLIFQKQRLIPLGQRSEVKVGENARKGILNATAASKAVSEILKISTGEDMPDHTIRTWVATWLKSKKGRSESTVRAYRTHTTNFLTWLSDRADNRLQSITTADMRLYRQWLLDGAGGKNKASQTTARLKMKTVSSIFLKAMAEGITNFNPVAALEALEEDDKLLRKPFTQEEVTQLIEAATSDEWRGLITMGAFTGLRLTDCALITWDKINLKTGWIKMVPAKTKRKNIEVKIPIHATLETWLNNQPTPIKEDTRVFQKLSTYTGAGRNGLSSQFAEIMGKSGVSRGESKNTGGRVMYQRSFHSLRHTLTSWLSEAKIDPEVRMKILGHKSEDVHAGYTHHGDDSLATAMGSIPKL